MFGKATSAPIDLARSATGASGSTARGRAISQVRRSRLSETSTPTAAPTCWWAPSRRTTTAQGLGLRLRRVRQKDSRARGPPCSRNARREDRRRGGRRPRWLVGRFRRRRERDEAARRAGGRARVGRQRPHQSGAAYLLFAPNRDRPGLPSQHDRRSASSHRRASRASVLRRVVLHACHGRRSPWASRAFVAAAGGGGSAGRPGQKLLKLRCPPRLGRVSQRYFREAGRCRRR